MGVTLSRISILPIVQEKTFISGMYHHAIIHPPQVSIDKTVRIVINRKKTVSKPGDPDPAEMIVIYSNGCSNGIILKSKIFYDQNEPEWLLIQKNDSNAVSAQIRSIS